MNCNDARQHWNLYHDSEGEADLHFRINEHLAICPDCAEWFNKQSRLESMVVEKLDPVATPNVWKQVLSGTGLVQPARVGRHWVWLAGVAASALAVSSLIWFLAFSSKGPDLTQLTAQWHDRLSSGEEPLPFESKVDLDVEAYLRKQVSFPVRCPPRKDAGFAVEGAGVCTLEDQPAAYLLGKVDDAPVSIFVLPRDSLKAFPNQRDVGQGQTHHSRQGRLQVAMAIIDRNAVLVIGQTDAESLNKVLRAYGTYPDHH